PDKPILAGFLVGFAPCSVSTLAGRHDGDVISLTRLPVNNPTVSDHRGTTGAQTSLTWEGKPTVPTSRGASVVAAQRITSSARERNVGGTVTPSASAVFRLTTNLN